MARSRRRRLPVLRRLAAHPARRHRPGQRRRPRVLRPADRRACARPASTRSAPPTTGTPRRPLEDDGRLAEQGHRRALRRVRRDRRRRGSPTGCRMWIPLNEPMVETLYGYAIGEYAPGKFLLFDALPDRAPPEPRARPCRAGAARGRRGQVGTANNHSPIWPASASAGDLSRGQVAGRAAQLAVRRPGACLGTYPEAMRPVPARRLRRRPAGDRVADGLLRRELLRAAGGRRAVGGQPAAVRPAARRGLSDDHQRHADRAVRTARVPDRPARPHGRAAAAGVHHRERLQRRRRRRGRRRRARPAPRRLPHRTPGARWRRRPTTASTCAGTSSGPCWTTSSGRRGTGRGSAWYTWTIATQAVRRRIPTAGIRA